MMISPFLSVVNTPTYPFGPVTRNEKPSTLPSEEVLMIFREPICGALIKPFPASFSTVTVFPSSVISK